jgi:hypothetical protein
MAVDDDDGDGRDYADSAAGVAYTHKGAPENSINQVGIGRYLERVNVEDGPKPVRGVITTDSTVRPRDSSQ